MGSTELGNEHIDILGISTESRTGGGCLHCGSGPVKSRVCNSGPACMTACNSLPLSGKAPCLTSRSASGGSGRWAGMAVGCSLNNKK
jgi:hypothetical protein